MALNKRHLFSVSSVFGVTLLIIAAYVMAHYPSGVKKAFNARNFTASDNHYPVVVIGGGVGGLTASLYLSLANISHLVLEGSTEGGLLTQSLSVRNWPGYLDSPGRTISEAIKKQAQTYGATITQEELVHIDTSMWPYRLTTRNVLDPSQTRVIQALSVIVAMGAQSRYLGIPGEKEYWSKGVTNCAVCEGSLYKDKEVCVVGGGDSAMEEASYLSSIARHVTVFVRSGGLRAVDKRKDEVLEKPNVTIVYNTVVKEIKGDGRKVTNIVIENTLTNTVETKPIDGVFLALGFIPNTQMFATKLSLTKEGYIRLFNDQETSVPGVYAVGDIVDPLYKQAITAAGDGCRAALQAQRFLSDVGYNASPGTIAPDKAKPLVAAETEKKQEEIAEALDTVNKEVSVSSEKIVADGTLHEYESEEQLMNALEGIMVPYVVDYYAPWCGPCKMITPLLQELAQKHKGSVAFIKVNIDKLPLQAKKDAIFGVPTVRFCKKDHSETNRLVGLQSLKVYENNIRTLLS